MALLQQALREALDASIPKTSSPLAVASHSAAEDLLRWVTLESNAARSERLTTSVVELLDKTFQQRAAINSQAARDKMWASTTAFAPLRSLCPCELPFFKNRVCVQSQFVTKL